MPQRSTAMTRYLRETVMNMSRNVQELFGTAEAVVVTQPDPRPNREGAYLGSQTPAERRRSRRGDHMSSRERRGRD
jgi:hypothetical protein